MLLWRLGMKEDYKTFLGLSNYSPRTIEVYTALKKHLPDMPIQLDINDFLAQKPYPLARSFLANYVREYLKNNKLEIKKIKGRIRETVRDKFLTEEEYIKFMSSLPLREELICRLEREGAFRQSAIIGCKKDSSKGLRCMDINFEKGEIKLNEKGKKEKLGLISKPTMEKLKAWIISNKLLPEDMVFKIHYSRVWRIMKAKSQQLLGKGVSSHWMKRTCGRWLEDMGYPLEERQYYLGHANPTTTQKCYSFKKGKDVIDKIKIEMKE
jgi:integrase